MAELNLEITSPDKVAFSGIVTSVTIPGTDGSFEVLVNHAPIISTFEIGTIKIVSNNSDIQFWATAGGTIEVLNNKILILSDDIELIKDIDVERAKTAKERAEKRISEKENKEIDVERAKASLRRAENRLKLTDMYLKINI